MTTGLHDASFADEFSVDEDGFEYGLTKGQLASAISIWTIVRDGDGSATVANAADAFRVSEALVREVVNGHSWMFVTAGDLIENDGL